MSYEMSERTFLIKQAIDIFNSTFSMSLVPEEFDIRSVEPSYGSTHGYHIYSLREDDELNIFLFFELGAAFQVHWVRLENQENVYASNKTGDEVFVIYLSLSDSLVNSGRYSFTTWYRSAEDDAVVTGVQYVENSLELIAYAEGGLFGYVQTGEG